MKNLFLQLAQYNRWANSRLINIIIKLPDEKLKEVLPSSFPSLYLTMLHMWNAESVWWQRIKLAENIKPPMESFKGTATELITNWEAQSKEWILWLEKSPEATIQHEFIYQNSKKERFRQPVSEMLQHLFIHQGYHRGQLVTMLHQLGISEIPATDFIVFARKK